MKTQIETEVNQIGRFKIIRLVDEDDDEETWFCDGGEADDSIAFINRELAELYATNMTKRETKAPAKPLWQMEIRQRLELSPNRTDAISRLLFSALYAAEDEDEFVSLVENHVDELQKTLAVLKAGAK